MHVEGSGIVELFKIEGEVSPERSVCDREETDGMIVAEQERSIEEEKKSSKVDSKGKFKPKHDCKSLLK